jgi:serine/threonine protein kinase/tetratricopeptide (TPR) repeat protein
MMGEWSNPAKTLFLTAIEQHAPEEWPAFLERACAGDVQLRAEVEKLLRAQSALGSFHDAPPAPPTTVDHPVPERSSAVLGPYKLLQQIGAGGMGVVYMAEQEHPVRRLVALKIIRPGMDSAQVIARFESERQALALMDHPNIARVFDAGGTESGRPYFVMELVPGGPITEFCDRHRLTLGARLELFLDVCRAIQHAHHKGIIHRDIKPTNVLVALRDGAPVVKVIDFGVAKATVLGLTDRALITTHGQLIGTPEYMSPEQAEGSDRDIDTRTDVYSLGVLLYELLTGTTPLPSKRLGEVSFAELQRLIREEEAPRPSARLSALGDGATALARKRGLSARQLAQFLAGDLEWVVLKALQKDRAQRYDTPGSLAEDIERYLRCEAIRARPPSAAYRLKRFTQRNRVAVLTGALTAAALLVGAAGATWQAVVATQAKRDAQAAAAAEREAKELAQAREAETRAVLEFVERRVLAAGRPAGQDGGLNRDVTIRQAVEAALPFVENSFPNQPLIEARLRLALGKSFWYLGDAPLAAELCQRARALFTQHLGPDHPDTLRSARHLARCYRALGRPADALALSEETLARCTTRFGPDHPETLRSMNNLACSYADLGRRAEALELRERTLALMRVGLGPDHPDTLRSMYDLATSYALRGQQAAALKLREETLARRRAKLGPTHPETLRSMNGVACSYAALGRHGDAAELYERALAQQQAALGADHPDTFQTMYNLAISLAALGRHAEALKLREEALALHTARLGATHPRTLMSMNTVASSYAALGRHGDALALFERTLALQKVRLGPGHRDTLWSMWGVARALVALDRGAEAVPVIDECLQRAADTVGALQLVPALVNLRLRHFQRTGDAAGCRRTAELWENLKRTDADSLYTAARLRAVAAAVLRAADTSPESARRADAEADRAMTWLEQVVAAGAQNRSRLERDRDLDALRDRPDFTQLVTALRGTPPEKQEGVPPEKGAGTPPAPDPKRVQQ